MHHGKVSKEIAEGLKELKARIDSQENPIPSSKLDETLNIATWNIREFGKKERTEAAIHYIAEILGQFDLVGVVELRDNLSDLKKVLEILGPYWNVVYSDMIPDAGGNRERIAYVYDKRAVVFQGLAAEASLPRTKEGGEYIPKFTWWRAPYFASFRAGNFDFVVLTAHIRWGKKDEDRINALKSLAEWVDAKKNEKYTEDRDIIIMGDFNIPSIGDDFFKAITSKGLVMPEPLASLEHGSNLDRNKRYDQILYYSNFPEKFAVHGGVLDFYKNDSEKLFPGMSKRDFTFQMSDHLPLWIQIDTDIDGFLLDQLIHN